MWQLVFSKRADKQLSKMDPSVRRVIVSWLLKNVDRCKNPRMHGKGLICNRSGEWRYSVGDYRALCEIRDGERVVLVLEIGHRRDIYEN